MHDISIVITAYNIEKYIERAVASALAQSGVSSEIVVVDDCSTDNTWPLISKMTDTRIRPIRLESNSGPGAARNAGFAAATAPWIAMLDSDDAMEPDRLRRMLACARDAHADIVIDNLLVFREQDESRYPLFAPKAFGRLHTMTLAAFIAGNCFFRGDRAYGYLKPVFSTDLVRRHSLAYDTEIPVGDDYFFLAEALACGAVRAVEATAGYHYTVRTGSLARSLSLADIDRLTARDRAFGRRYALPPDAQKAQRRRDRSLKDARYFYQLRNALKEREFGVGLKVAVAHPPVARHMWRPVYERVRRMLTKLWTIRLSERPRDSRGV